MPFKPDRHEVVARIIEETWHAVELLRISSAFRIDSFSLPPQFQGSGPITRGAVLFNLFTIHPWLVGSELEVLCFHLSFQP